MKQSGISVKVACYTTSIKEWFDSTLPLKILPDFPAKYANAFRKRNIKGFVTIGGCNYYIGLSYNGTLIGILGFLNPDYGSYNLMLKADTTPQSLKFSTDLLLYILRTKEVKKLLENRFNREMKTVYSMCFSKHQQINRYRKHGKLITKKPIRINKKSANEALKRKANAKVLTELKAGRLTKQPCEVCGISDYVEAHHKDYSKPLDINWLCVEHHNERDGIDETCYKITGYNLGYLFELGTIPSLKAAKAEWMQKHKI